MGMSEYEQAHLEAYSISEKCVELHPMDIRPQPGDSVVTVARL